MKQQQSSWLLMVIGSVMLLVGLAIAPGSNAQANELSAETARAHVAPLVVQKAKTAGLAYTADITFTPAFTAYLPLVSNYLVLPPAGIYGQITYQGAPLDGVEIQLVLWHKAGNSWFSNSWETLYALTQLGGRYQFTTAVSLNSDQKYSVRFRNTANDTRFLNQWTGSSIYAYTAGQVLAGGDIELAEMVYLLPANHANVGLPITFQWQLRTGSPSDNYVLELFKPNEAVLFRTPQLGYAATYTLNSLPAGFTTGVQYGWYIYVYGPGDSYGLTNQYGWVTFH